MLRMNKRFDLHWNENIVKKTIKVFSIQDGPSCTILCSCIYLGVGDRKCWYLFIVDICTKICTYIYTCKYRLCTTSQKIIILNLSLSQFIVSQRKQWCVFILLVGLFQWRLLFRAMLLPCEDIQAELGPKNCLNSENVLLGWFLQMRMLL